RPGAILADRMELSLTKLIKDKEKLTGYATWGADQIGRWIGAVSVEAATTGKDIASHLKPKVQELIAAQDAHGIFYGAKLAADPSQDNKLRVWFGQARALWNLQEYWRITRDVRTLAALRHAADITVAHQDEL